MSARRLYLAQRTRKSLDEYLGRFELELDAESCPRHLEHVAMCCSLLLDRLEVHTGRTEETAAYARRIGALTRRGVEMWLPARGPVKARPRLKLVTDNDNGGEQNGEVTR